MIRSFACKDTEKIYNGLKTVVFPGDIQGLALRKLRQLDAARSTDDLKNPPGNRLETLKGNRNGQMSIRINNQWRICFVWQNNESCDVEIVDYH